MDIKTGEKLERYLAMGKCCLLVLILKPVRYFYRNIASTTHTIHFLYKSAAGPLGCVVECVFVSVCVLPQQQPLVSHIP